MYCCDQGTSDHYICCDCGEPCSVNKAVARRGPSGRKRNFERLRKQWSIVGKTGENCFRQAGRAKNDGLLTPSATLCKVIGYLDDNSGSSCSRCIGDRRRRCRGGCLEASSAYTDNSESCTCLCAACRRPTSPHRQTVDIESDDISYASSCANRTSCNSEDVIHVTVRRNASGCSIDAAKCDYQRGGCMTRSRVTLTNESSLVRECRISKATASAVEVSQLCEEMHRCCSHTHSEAVCRCAACNHDCLDEDEAEHLEKLKEACETICNELCNEMSECSVKGDGSFCGSERKKIRHGEDEGLRQEPSVSNNLADALSELTDKSEPQKAEKLQPLDEGSADINSEGVVPVNESNNEEKVGGEQKEVANWPDPEKKSTASETATAQTSSDERTVPEECIKELLLTEVANAVPSEKSAASYETVTGLNIELHIEIGRESSSLVESVKLDESPKSSINTDQINNESERTLQDDEINSETRSNSEHETQLYDTNDSGEKGAKEEKKNTNNFCAFDINQSFKTDSTSKGMPKQNMLLYITKSTQKSVTKISSKACQIPSNSDSKCPSRADCVYCSGQAAHKCPGKKFKFDVAEHSEVISRKKTYHARCVDDDCIDKYARVARVHKDRPIKPSSQCSGRNIVIQNYCECKCKCGDNCVDKDVRKKEVKKRENRAIINKRACEYSSERTSKNSEKRKNNYAKPRAEQMLSDQAVDDAICKKRKRCKNKSFEEEFLMMKSSTKHQQQQQQRIRRKWLISEVFRLLILKCESWLPSFHQQGEEGETKVYLLPYPTCGCCKPNHHTLYCYRLKKNDET